MKLEVLQYIYLRKIQYNQLNIKMFILINIKLQNEEKICRELNNEEVL